MSSLEYTDKLKEKIEKNQLFLAGTMIYLSEVLELVYTTAITLVSYQKSLLNSM
jgi:hypothetical protein